MSFYNYQNNLRISILRSLKALILCLFLLPSSGAAEDDFSLGGLIFQTESGGKTNNFLVLSSEYFSELEPGGETQIRFIANLGFDFEKRVDRKEFLAEFTDTFGWLQTTVRVLNIEDTPSYQLFSPGRVTLAGDLLGGELQPYLIRVGVGFGIQEYVNEGNENSGMDFTHSYQVTAAYAFGDKSFIQNIAEVHPKPGDRDLIKNDLELHLVNSESGEFVFKHRYRKIPIYGEESFDALDGVYSVKKEIAAGYVFHF